MWGKRPTYKANYHSDITQTICYPTKLHQWMPHFDVPIFILNFIKHVYSNLNFIWLNCNEIFGILDLTLRVNVLNIKCIGWAFNYSKSTIYHYEIRFDHDTAIFRSLKHSWSCHPWNNHFKKLFCKSSLLWIRRCTFSF